MFHTNHFPYSFIVVEGIDGCGKGTLIEKLKACFWGRGAGVWFTQEPTDSYYGKAIRRILANGGRDARGKKVSREDLQLFYIGDRMSHRITEAKWLRHGAVVSDRDWESTLAYFTAFGGNPSWVVERHETSFRKAGQIFFVSDLTLILDITAEEATRRQEGQGKEFDYFEDAIQKRQKIREAYLSLPGILRGLKQGTPFNIQTINGMQSPERVFAEALKHIEGVIEAKREKRKTTT